MDEGSSDRESAEGWEWSMCACAHAYFRAKTSGWLEREGGDSAPDRTFRMYVLPKWVTAVFILWSDRCRWPDGGRRSWWARPSQPRSGLASYSSRLDTREKDDRVLVLLPSSTLALINALVLRGLWWESVTHSQLERNTRPLFGVNGKRGVKIADFLRAVIQYIVRVHSASSLTIG